MRALEITSEELPGGIDRISLAGEVDLTSVDLVHAHLAASFARGTRLLVIDLGQLRFMDSSLLLAITRAVGRARAVGGDVALVCRDENLCRILEIYGLSRNVGVYDELDAAVAALRGGGSRLSGLDART